MSPVELLVRLYDECIKSFRISKKALEEKNYEVFEDNILHCRKIVMHFIKTLDMNQEISWELLKLYNYVVYDISRIQTGREKYLDEIDEMINIISDIRDGFKEAGNKLGPGYSLPEEKRIMV